MSDTVLNLLYQNYLKQWDKIMADDEWEGGGGSPLEFYAERLEDIELEINSRKNS